MAETKRKTGKSATGKGDAAPKTGTADRTKPAAVPQVLSKSAKATAEKPAKPKLVRDSFTMPEEEYAVIATLKERCLDAGVVAKKSEILRAGIKALADMNDARLVAAIADLAPIKTGRPPKKDV